MEPIVRIEIFSENKYDVVISAVVDNVTRAKDDGEMTIAIGFYYEPLDQIYKNVGSFMENVSTELRY